MDLADYVNKYINEETPWKKDEDEAVKISTTSLNAFKILSIYLHPVIPNLTNEAFNFLNIIYDALYSSRDQKCFRQRCQSSKFC